jgi:hypothetical protein
MPTAPLSMVSAALPTLATHPSSRSFTAATCGIVSTRGCTHDTDTVPETYGYGVGVGMLGGRGARCMAGTVGPSQQGWEASLPSAHLIYGPFHQPQRQRFHEEELNAVQRQLGALGDG